MQLLVIALATLILDQAVKYMVIQKMIEGQSIPIIPHIFHLTFVKNVGAAFGILANQILFFVFIGLLAVIAIVFFYSKLKPEHKLLRLALALQLGGALGNLIDRIRLGYVVDLFDFRIWPVFNIADSAIVIGVVLLIWEILRNPEGEKA